MNASNESLIPASGKLTYISNAGVFIQLKDRKILMDGLCRSNTPIYKDPSADIALKIKGGIPPFDHLDLMLITHEHSDHFDPISVHEFQENNPQTVILSTPYVISKLRAHAPLDKGSHNLMEIDLKLHQGETLTVQGIKIRIFSLAHMGKNQEETRNYAYLIEYGLKLFHVGDASPVPENYDQLNLLPEKINCLIAPFPYIGLPSARRVIKDFINPQKIAILHFPHKELDRFGWIRATKKSFTYIRKDFMETNFLEELGMTLIL